ncbi:MAG: phosphoglucomutase (alpha-D-glucose-1,6-bisphosphate-dependent) [Terriglobia bacterium]
MKSDPRAGLPADSSDLVDVSRLVAAYYSQRPDPAASAQRVSFGTSGHRGSSFNNSFNEEHILAITQAICDYRRQCGITGPLFLGKDTHALSGPAAATAIEVLAANDVTVMIDRDDGYTPTPVVSHAILTHNQGGATALADGIVVTPSHNPPEDGGFKYNGTSGGPADTDATGWIESRSNELLEHDLAEVLRMPYEKALRAATTHRYDYVAPYVNDLGAVLDTEVIRSAKLKIGVDPLGGAGVAYWDRISERFGFQLTVMNAAVDPTFRFMSLDWDGRIRMDCSSPYAMAGLIGLKEQFDIAFACDTDHDRHGVVTRSAGLLNPNHYLSASIFYLFHHRPSWGPGVAVGKTLVSSSMIDRVTADLGRRLMEVPVGFKWFVKGLLGGSLGFAGEESAGAAFLRRKGSAWTTDKDGIIMGLLAAEMTAHMGRDPAEIYRGLTDRFGAPLYERIDAPATPQQRAALKRFSPDQVKLSELAGEKIETMLTTAPGNGSPIGGIKVIAAHGWFAARPSGTEDVYKLYTESFLGVDHLRRIQEEARHIIDRALAASSPADTAS